MKLISHHAKCWTSTYQAECPLSIQKLSGVSQKSDVLLTNTWPETCLLDSGLSIQPLSMNDPVAQPSLRMFGLPFSFLFYFSCLLNCRNLLEERLFVSWYHCSSLVLLHTYIGISTRTKQHDSHLHTLHLLSLHSLCSLNCSRAKRLKDSFLSVLFSHSYCKK